MVRLTLLSITLTSTVLLGCSGSSPRFSSSSRATSSGADEATGSEDAAATEIHREISEEVRENDAPVDVQSVVLTIASLPSENAAIDHRRLIDEILSMIGTPYRFSGTDSLGIDCSGFTARVYHNALRVDLPRSTRDQFETGRVVARNERTLGDLLFFRTRGGSPSHVGLYLGKDLFAHASVSQGVTISSLRSTYYRVRYVGARRIVN